MTDTLLEAKRATPSSWDVRRLTGALGAEVTGIDLRSLDDGEFERLYHLWLEHLVLFFPAQHLTAAEQVAFSSRWGEILIHPTLPSHPDHPEICIVDELTKSSWHTDVTCDATPPKTSILNMVHLPEVGGDTIWVNSQLAYETLSAPVRAMIDQLTAVHDGTGFGRPDIQAEHPVVRVHPETGRRSLFVNGAFTKSIPQLNDVEGPAVLKMLLEWQFKEPQFQVRYRWSLGTIAMWDNRCTQHRPVHDYSGPRRVERVTIRGDVPTGVQ